MFTLKNKLILSGIALLILAVAGCIFSGTFVVNKTVELSDMGGFYAERVDLTTSATWKKHKDEIQLIETVGFELYITNNEADDVAFWVYADEAAGAAPNPTSVPATARVVIDSLNVAPGPQKITYVESLTVINNLDHLKELVKSGLFDIYAKSTGNTGDTFKIDSVTIVVTFTAG